MADKEKPKDSAPPAKEGEAAAGAKKKKLPIKTFGVVGAIMIAEAVAVIMVFGMGGPKNAAADVGEHEIVADDSEKIQEIQVLADASQKFQNMQTGKVWIWDISIFVQVKNKHAEEVLSILESRQAEITEAVNQIVAKAHHNHLREPERQTLTRQVTTYLQKLTEPKHGGEPLIDRVLIPKCNGFPADF